MLKNKAEETTKRRKCMSDSVTNMEERIEYLEGQILELQKKNLS